MCKVYRKALALGFALTLGNIANAQTPDCNVACPGPNLGSNVAGGGDTIAYPKGGDYLTEGRTVGDGGTVFADCEDVVFVSRALYTAGSYAYFVQSASFSVDGVVDGSVVLNTMPNFVLAPLGQCDAGSGSGPLQEFAPVFIPSPSPSVGSPITTTYEVRFNGRILSGACGSAGAFVTRELNFVTCDDGNECTDDSCEPGIGCSNTPVVCADDNNPCTENRCDPVLGCVYDEVVCNDGNGCTDDRCVQTPVPDSLNGATTVTCEYTEIACNDGNPCTDDRCDATTDPNQNPTWPCVYTDNGTCGQNGCTPGFWKSCNQQWAGTGYTYPGPALNTIFTFPSSLSSLGTKTLADALGFQGGSTPEGGAQILLRAAAAALLNAGKGIGYPLTTAQIISQVNTALAGTRADMVTLAGILDGYNNLGCRDRSGNSLPCKVRL